MSYQSLPPPSAGAANGLDRLFARVMGWVVWGVLALMGLVFALSLLAAALILACIWAIRAGWARLTGRPVTPWVMRVDPREGWNRFYQSPGPWPRREPGPLARLDQSDVTDVEVKEPPRN